MESRYWAGGLMIIIGTVMTGQRLGLWQPDWSEIWSTWWPLLLVAAGIIRLSRKD